jgi:hypothetical protein
VAASPGLRAVEVIRARPAATRAHLAPTRGHPAAPRGHPAAPRGHPAVAFLAPRNCPPAGHRARAAAVCPRLRRNVPPVAPGQQFRVAVRRNFHQAIVPAERNVPPSGRPSLGFPAARAPRNGPRNRQPVPAGPSVRRSCPAKPVGFQTGLRNCPANPAPELHSVPTPDPPSAPPRVTSEISSESPEALRQAVPSAEHLLIVPPNFQQSAPASANAWSRRTPGTS